MQILIYFVLDVSYCMVPTQPPTSSSLGKTAGAQPWQARPDVCRNMFFFFFFTRKEEQEKKYQRGERGNVQNMLCVKQIEGVFFFSNMQKKIRFWRSRAWPDIT